MSWNAKVACRTCGVLTWVADTDCKFDRRAARYAGGRAASNSGPDFVTRRSVKDNDQRSVYCSVCGDVIYREVTDPVGKKLRVCGEAIEMIDGAMPDKYTAPEPEPETPPVP